MLTVDEAREQILSEVSVLPAERVGVAEALFRVLAEDVTSARELPPFDNSQMDGYAVRSAELAGASEANPISLRVTSKIHAGETPSIPVGPGEAARIMTGATMPQGADAVVMQEQTRAEGDRVQIQIAPKPGEFVRPRGEDAKIGERALTRGTVLGPAQIALLAALGRSQASVVHRPRVGVLSTGDELCEIDAQAPDRIVDSNSWGLCAQIEAAGAIPVRLGIARDDRSEIARLVSAGARCDVVLTSAGVSVGERDFVKEVLESQGVDLRFWKVAMKPGKPLVFGVRGEQLFFGLPGNPTSSMVSFDQFVRPALLKLQGHTVLARPRLTATLGAAFRKPKGLTFFVRAMTRIEGGGFVTRPVARQGSGLIRSMADANSFLIFGSDSEGAQEGSPVEVELFDRVV